jgi:hypothetical protein
VLYVGAPPLYPEIHGRVPAKKRGIFEKFKKSPKIRENVLCELVGIFRGFPLPSNYPYGFRTPGTPGSVYGYPGYSRVPDPNLMYTVRTGSSRGVEWSLPLPDPSTLSRYMTENVIRYKGNRNFWKNFSKLYFFWGSSKSDIELKIDTKMHFLMLYQMVSLLFGSGFNNPDTRTDNRNRPLNLGVWTVIIRFIFAFQKM